MSQQLYTSAEIAGDVNSHQLISFTNPSHTGKIVVPTEGTPVSRLQEDQGYKSRCRRGYKSRCRWCPVLQRTEVLLYRKKSDGQSTEDRNVALERIATRNFCRATWINFLDMETSKVVWWWIRLWLQPQWVAFHDIVVPPYYNRPVERRDASCLEAVKVHHNHGLVQLAPLTRNAML